MGQWDKAAELDLGFSNGYSSFRQSHMGKVGTWIGPPARENHHQPGIINSILSKGIWPNRLMRSLWTNDNQWLFLSGIRSGIFQVEINTLPNWAHWGNLATGIRLQRCRGEWLPRLPTGRISSNPVVSPFCWWPTISPDKVWMTKLGPPLTLMNCSWNSWDFSRSRGWQTRQVKSVISWRLVAGIVSVLAPYRPYLIRLIWSYMICAG